MHTGLIVLAALGMSPVFGQCAGDDCITPQFLPLPDPGYVACMDAYQPDCSDDTDNDDVSVEPCFWPGDVDASWWTILYASSDWVWDMTIEQDGSGPGSQWTLYNNPYCVSVDIAPFVDDFGSTYEGCTNETSVFESLFLPSGYYLFQVDGVSSNGQVTVCFTGQPVLDLSVPEIRPHVFRGPDGFYIMRNGLKYDLCGRRLE